MTLSQVRDVAAVQSPDVPSYVSVFAGLIVDTGRDPVPMMVAAVELLIIAPPSELVWASPLELLIIFQSDDIGCQVIAVTKEHARNNLSIISPHPLSEGSKMFKLFHAYS
jgi:transaldolase